MPFYRIDATRIREVTELVTFEIEAPDQDAAIEQAHQMEDDGELDFKDSEDLPDWRDFIVDEITPIEALTKKPVLLDHVCDSYTRWSISDAKGIFCCYACVFCEEEKRARYRPEIFTDPNYETTEAIDE